jgi:hypothetical protein
LGDGAPDLFAYTPRTGWLALECKTSKGTLTPEQTHLHRCADVRVVRTVKQALALFTGGAK